MMRQDRTDGEDFLTASRWVQIMCDSTCEGVRLLNTGGHSLAARVDQAAALSGVEIKRAYVDGGYVDQGIECEGLDITISHTWGITSPTVRREIRPSNGIKPVIGHKKDDVLPERNQLAGAAGDAANVVLCAASHNVHLLDRWLWLTLLRI